MAQPISSQPWQDVAGISNFRDLGGYPLVGRSGSVKRGIIYRSAEPNYATPEGVETLTGTLGVTASYDLRSRGEVEQQEVAAPMPVPLSGTEGGGSGGKGGLRRYAVPVFEDEDLGSESLNRRSASYISGHLSSAYREILRSGAPHAYRRIFTHLLMRPTEPLLIHCTAGKDRTGVICALILLLAGVGDDVVAQEYALTEVGLEPFKEAIRVRLRELPVFAGGGEGARVGIENMLSSTVETMVETIRMVKEEFGGVEAVLRRDCGFTGEEVERIRANIVSEEAPSLGLDAEGKIAVVVVGGGGQ